MVAGPGRAYRRFLAALQKVCHSLALQIVADGEGAKRVIEIEVRGAPTGRQAERVARTIASSPLVKTMFAGGDPNWGRVLAAAGRSGVKFDPDAHRRVSRRPAGLPPRHGASVQRKTGAQAHDARPGAGDDRSERAGRGRARVWTCDFTSDYVHINASYRT